ncbi:methyltransferase FGSG_00040-like [Zingiber officinale]|uniref:SET domain-containing protein n=1 Tax=Zingiber officinale TaxID=94328 RepID=A0A8J5EYR7_ZINOF|nr:methyltransferase FGSG_00040-like [Zingiber officinale]KAG6476720.1 hypothetical protein ZIOFF_065967 [Zingiber officinale]
MKQAVSLEEQVQHLRSKATELLLREDWAEYINLYSHLISLCLAAGDGAGAALHKTLCLAHSNRAEARFRTRDLAGALRDCDRALEFDPAHLKSLLRKARVLLDLDRYASAGDCLKLAIASHPGDDASRELLVRCRNLEAQSRRGRIDVSNWILGGFGDKCPDLAEYVGPVEIRRCSNGERGLFATKNVEAGTPLVVTRAVVAGRGILPESAGGHGDSARMLLWKDFVEKVLDVAEKCSRTLNLIYQLSPGTDQGDLEVPDIALFKPDAVEQLLALPPASRPDVDRILKVLDVNCLSEEAFSTKIDGKQSNYIGIGLWLLPSFLNHSCSPSARRQHIGDHAIVHAARDLRAGEEVTIAYFDVLSPIDDRRTSSRRWAFECRCERCDFEDSALFGPKMREMEAAMKGGASMEETVMRLEEGMRRWEVKGKQKGFLRASIWPAYASVYGSERLMRRCGRKIPVAAVVAESVAEAVGGDERVLKAVLGRMKKGCGDVAEMEKAMRLGRATYGKIMKRTTMKALFQLPLLNNGV